MDTVDNEIRDRSLRTILFLMLAYFIFDICYSALEIVFVEGIEVSSFVGFRIILPNSINLFTYIVCSMLNKQEDISDNAKNWIICFGMCTICGSIMICHSFYVSLWLLPTAPMIYCSVFKNRGIRIALMCYSIVLDVLATVQVCYEEPDDMPDYFENLMIVIAMTVMVFMIASVLEEYNIKQQNMRESMYRKELEYKTQISHDTLTGVYSRAYLAEIQKSIFAKDIIANGLVLGMIDIDDFKLVNDAYGHEKGDDVLRYMGNMFKSVTHDKLFFARFGGEEFIVFFLGTPIEQAREMMDNLRVRIQNKKFDFTSKPVTFSCGLAVAHETDDFDELLKRADGAMYESKSAGKNRVTCKV